MPLLREIAIARAYAVHGPIPELRHAWARVKLPTPLPWPPREMLQRHVLIDGYDTDLADLVEVLEGHLDELRDADQSIWSRFWSLIETLDTSENHPYWTVTEQAFHAADLAAALGKLPLTSHLADLHEHLQARLARRPQGYFAVLRWV
jgi:hypothetical protein